MIKVTVFYPDKPGCRFDFAYYCDTHMPMVRERLGDACQGVAVDRGISGATPASSPRYFAITHLFFDSIDAFRDAWGPHEADIVADVPNYTDIEPELQISEVLINARRSETGPLHVHFPPEGD